MIPTKEGQIVKFHTPLPDENPNQQYVVLEIHLQTDRPRAQIQALNTGLPFPPVSLVAVKDLEVVEADASELIGHLVTIKKPDASEVKGKVVKVKDDKLNLDLSKTNSGVETNVWLTVEDEQGVEHLGTLFIN